MKINLGLSYSIRQGIDVFQTMTESQGSYAYSTVTYPTGSVSESADDLHSASYISRLACRRRPRGQGQLCG